MRQAGTQMSLNSLSLCVDSLTAWLDLSHAGSYRDEQYTKQTGCTAYYASTFAREVGNEAVLFCFMLHISTMSCGQMLLYIKVHRVHEDPPIGFPGNTAYLGLALR